MSIPELLPHYKKVGFSPKRAVQLIVEGKLAQGNSKGGGHEAERRAENERQLREIFEELGSFGIGLTTQDVDAMAEIYTEGRTFPQRHPNFKE